MLKFIIQAIGVSMSKIVALKSTINETAVKAAEGLLERCKSGETISYTAIEDLKDDKYAVSGSSIESKTRMAGMLLDAAIIRLKQD
jgi:hypothetical protein